MLLRQALGEPPGQPRYVASEYAYWLRDYDRSVDLARQALDFAPAFPRAHFLIGRVQEHRGEILAAIDSYGKAGMLTENAAAEARAALTAEGGRIPPLVAPLGIERARRTAA